MFLFLIWFISTSENVKDFENFVLGRRYINKPY